MVIPAAGQPIPSLFGAQILPSDDAFDQGGSFAFDYPTLWLNWGWWRSTAYSVPHPTSGTYALNCNDEAFSDYLSLGSGAATLQGEATSGTTPSGLVFRDLSTSSKVEGFMRFHARRICGGNNYDPNDLVKHGWIGARIAGGAYSSVTHNLRDNGTSTGYFFGFRYEPALGASWYLLRQNGTTVTVLASRVFTGAHKTLDEFEPRRFVELKLLCETVAGNVHLVGSYRSTVAGVFQSEAIVFDITDSSGSKITTAGRVGFALPGRAQAAATPAFEGVVLIDSLEVDVDGVQIVNDLWERAWPDARALFPTAGPFALCSQLWRGVRVESGWTGDFSSSAGWLKSFARCTFAADKVCVSPAIGAVATGTVAGGWFVAQRPAESSTEQRRRLRARFSTKRYDGGVGVNPSAPRRVGIGLRISSTALPSPTMTPNAGYMACLVLDDNAATSRVEVYRFSTTGAVLLARKDPFAVTADVDYDVDFEAVNAADGASLTLLMRVDGVQVVLDAVHGSITVNGAGTIKDSSPERVMSGRTQAIFASTVLSTSTGKTFVLGPWSRIAPPPPPPNEFDDESIVLHAEDWDFTGQTLTLPLSWPVEETPLDLAHRNPVESGHLQVCPQHSRGRRIFSVGVRGLTDAQRDDLFEFWSDHDGCVKAFEWTPQSETTALRVHFSDPKLGGKLVDRGVSNFDFTIEELVS